MSEGALLPSLRVLDLASGDADAVSRIFADLGADVLKVEPPGGAAGRTAAPAVDGVESGSDSVAAAFGIPGQQLAPRFGHLVVVSVTAAVQVARVALVAYFDRLRCGKGEFIDFSWFEAVVQALDPPFGTEGQAVVGVRSPDRLSLLSARQWRSGAVGARPLEGMRILGLGAIVAGGELGRLVAELGADVIKIESAAYPDGLRHTTPVHTSTTWSLPARCSPVSPSSERPPPECPSILGHPFSSATARSTSARRIPASSRWT